MSNRQGNRKANNSKNTSSPSPAPQTQSIGMNPMFMNMFTSLLQQMNVAESVEIDDIKEKIVNKVLGKIGISPDKLEQMCDDGTSHKVLNLIDDLSSTKSYDFLILHTYKEGNTGYISFKGTYKDAKQHALLCLGKEHGMLDVLPDEEPYLVRRYPIYTLRTDRVTIEVIPHASWISIENP